MTKAQTVAPESASIFAEHLPRIRSLGRMIFDPVWAERTHAPQGVELLHVIEGQMTLELQGERFAAGPGGTLLVPPGAMHRDEFDLSQGLDIFYCSFTWHLSKPFFERVDNHIMAAMSAERRTQLAAMLDHLRADPLGRTPAEKALLGGRLLSIMLFLLREIEDPPPVEEGSSTRGLMVRAKEYIHQHYNECVALDEIARALDVSSYHLSHAFSQESDFTLFAYLTHVRMDRAKEMLRAGKMNISEVARAVGYEDPNYFSKVFRKHCGSSPSSYK